VHDWLKIQDAKIAKNSPSAHHRTTLSGCMFAAKATIGKVVKKQYLLHMSSQYGERVGPLTAETGSGVWGTSANFNGFHVLASLLHRHHSMEVSQTLHDVWPSPGLVHYRVQSSLCVQVLHSPILAALLHGTRGVGVSKTFRRGIFTRQSGHPIGWSSSLFAVIFINIT